jgi:hypothetical protein
LARVGVEKNRLQKMDEACADFKLLTHSQLLHNMTDILALKEEQTIGANKRVDECRNTWIAKADRSFADLTTKMKDISNKYTQIYKQMDWEKPFPFIRRTPEDKLHNDYNKMVEMAYPMANYCVFEAFATNAIAYVIYSDCPQFEEKVLAMKDEGKLTKGPELHANFTQSVQSKVCAFQFFSLDEPTINSLVKLKDEVAFS